MKSMRFWGVIVKPGETVKYDPGESLYHISQIALEAERLKVKENVEVFVKVDGRKIKLGTLSVENHPQILTDQVFNKEFELLHSSKISSISIIGYQFETMERYNSSTKQGDELDEEVPLAIPLDFNVEDDKRKEATHIANKLSAPGPAAVPSSKPKATVEDTNSAGKPKANDKDMNWMVDAQDCGDDNDSESADQDVNYTPKKTKGKSRPVETSLMTPLGKNTEITTPSMGKQTGSAVGKRSVHVHVATPHPAKHAKKTPANNEKSKKSTGHVHFATPHPAKQSKTPASSNNSKQSTGNLHNRTFNSSMGLEAHSRVKHGAK